MHTFAPRHPRRVLRAALAVCAVCALASATPANKGSRRPGQNASQQPAAQQSRDATAQSLRIPRQQAQNTAALDGIVRDSGFSNITVPVPGAQLTLRNLQSGQTYSGAASGEGVFRVFPIQPGQYELRITAPDYGPFVLADLSFAPNEVVTLEISLVTSAAIEARSRLPRQPELGPALSATSEESFGTYREFRHRLDSDPAYVLNPAPEVLPPVADVYSKIPDRWQLQQPEYRRYSPKGEYLYVKPHWYDPFNRNKFKGDEPVWPSKLGQQTFLNLTATSDTFFDGRRVPSPSNVSTADPGSPGFFGRGEQAFLDQTFRVTFDLFHGDASFKPVDWRIRITPEVSLNDLKVRELGI
ncbi:MAG TPA: carboxypeptidase-like regulatory domain-containing protein, partial [Candidatus Acidoferrum sp.]|nr:carboxypeptidase-like regulatory domain-containing protein [Candidatus Acidoferrum sp.]